MHGRRMAIGDSSATETLSMAAHVKNISLYLRQALTRIFTCRTLSQHHADLGHKARSGKPSPPPRLVDMRVENLSLRRSNDAPGVTRIQRTVERRPYLCMELLSADARPIYHCHPCELGPRPGNALLNSDSRRIGPHQNV